MTSALFLGLKGGVGTTAVAASYARRLSTGGVLLLDLDLTHGDLAARIGVRGVASTVADIAPLQQEELDANALRAISYPMPGGSGWLVPSPAHPELAELIEPALIARLLDIARAQTPTLVVDGGSAVTAQLLPACLAVQEIVLVGRADAVCARQAEVIDDLFTRAGVSAPRRVHVPGWRGARRLSHATGLPAWQPARQRAMTGRLALPRTAAVARALGGDGWRR